MNLYPHFKNLDLDFSKVGLVPGPKRSDYFCTPRGARIIGWAGVDGIHYCFLREFGEMVFAVSPMDGPEYVHPIAGNFQDFLRLWLACGDLAALEQAHGWDQARFDAFLAAYPPDAEQQAILDAMAQSLELEPMKDPFDYIKSLQADFDYSAIRYKREYYDLVPEAVRPAWRVTYDDASVEPGQEMIISKVFSWGGYTWHIPAVYDCPEGLVMDFCVEVEPERISSFWNKWGQLIESCLTEEQHRALLAENPMDIFHFRCDLTVNSRGLREESSSRVQWIPDGCIPAELRRSEGAMDLIEHYGLDPEMGWNFHRVKFPWAAERMQDIKSISLTLFQLPQAIPGLRFPTPDPGKALTFLHPITGQEHSFTVLSVEPGQLEHHRDFGGMEIPTHYLSFSYTLSPDLTKKQCSIRDTAPSDSPKVSQGKAASGSGAAAIGIIGGADGPTSILFTPTGQTTERTAVSSLHFQPVEQVQWQMVFHEKLVEDIELSLI